MPIVRTSVHGLKTMGRSPFNASILVHRAKALEKSILGPGTLPRQAGAGWRTWGTRPVPNGSIRRVTPAGLQCCDRRWSRGRSHLWRPGGIPQSLAPSCVGRLEALHRKTELAFHRLVQDINQLS